MLHSLAEKRNPSVLKKKSDLGGDSETGTVFKVSDGVGSSRRRIITVADAGKLSTTANTSELSPLVDHSIEENLFVTPFSSTERRDHILPPSRHSSDHHTVAEEGRSEMEEASHWVTRRRHRGSTGDLEKWKPRSGTTSSPKSRPLPSSSIRRLAAPPTPSQEDTLNLEWFPVKLEQVQSCLHIESGHNKEDRGKIKREVGEEVILRHRRLPYRKWGELSQGELSRESFLRKIKFSFK